MRVCGVCDGSVVRVLGGSVMGMGSEYDGSVVCEWWEWCVCVMEV